MEILRRILSSLVRGAIYPFRGHNPLWALVPLSILVGSTMLMVFKLVSNQKAISSVKAKLMAYLYEMRLFVDDPLLVWKAQWGLIVANIRYVFLMMTPALVMSVPMLLILGQFECFFGYTPLKPGESAIVTMQMTRNGI